MSLYFFNYINETFTNILKDKNFIDRSAVVQRDIYIQFFFCDSLIEMYRCLGWSLFSFALGKRRGNFGKMAYESHVAKFKCYGLCKRGNWRYRADLVPVSYILLQNS